MVLKELISTLDYCVLNGTEDINIENMVYDSRFV